MKNGSFRRSVSMILCEAIWLHETQWEKQSGKGYRLLVRHTDLSRRGLVFVNIIINAKIGMGCELAHIFPLEHTSSDRTLANCLSRKSSTIERPSTLAQIWEIRYWQGIRCLERWRALWPHCYSINGGWNAQRDNTEHIQHILWWMKRGWGLSRRQNKCDTNWVGICNAYLPDLPTRET